MTPTTHPDPAAEPGGQRAVEIAAGRGASRTAAFVAVAIVSGIAWGVGRDLWFFSDEWNIFAGYHRGRLLEPFNSHLSLVPVALFQALFHTVGVDSYVPYRLVGLASFALLGMAVWRYGAARVGPVTAVIAAAWVVWGSGGVTNVMLPFLLNFSLPVAALAALWWNLDRSEPEPTPRQLGAVCGWLTVALATSGLGLMVAAAVGIELVVDRRSRRWWIAAAPGPLLWFAWYLRWGVDSPAHGGLGAVASYAARMLWGGCRALGADTTVGGIGVAVMLAALLAGSLTRRWSSWGRLAGAWATPVVFAALTAWSRIGVVPRIPPDELRYRWTVAAFLILAAASSLPVESTFRRTTPGRAAFAAASALAVAGLVLLVQDCRRWADTVAEARPGLEAVAFAAESGGPEITRSRVIPLSYVAVTAGDYLDAVADVGSPLQRLDLTRWRGRPDQSVAADEVLADGMRLRGSPPCTRDPGRSAQQVTAEPGTALRIDGRRGGRIELRRFVDQEQPTTALVALGNAEGIVLPTDAPSALGERPYVLMASPGTALTVCEP